MFGRPGTWLSLSALLALGCGEPQLVLDETTVDQRIGWMDTTVPLCQARAVTGRSAVRGAIPEIARLARLGRTLATAGRVVPLGGLRSNGSCGGSVDATSEHANGITDYVVIFSAFCMNTNEGQMIVDGTIDGREVGTPSDAGPVVKAFDLSTDGPITVEHGGATMELELDGGHADYGNPAAWAPGAPDEAHPDVITVDRGSATFPDAEGRVDFVSGLRIERVGSVPATLRILDGVAGTADYGQVDIRTKEDDPVILDLGTYGVTGGTIELVGAQDTLVEIRRDPVEAGVIQVTLNGQPYDTAVDCGQAREPLIEAGVALLGLLPIH